jgi:hypothetical protein
MLLAGRPTAAPTHAAGCWSAQQVSTATAQQKVQGPITTLSTGSCRKGLTGTVHVVREPSSRALPVSPHHQAQYSTQHINIVHSLCMLCCSACLELHLSKAAAQPSPAVHSRKQGMRALHQPHAFMHPTGQTDQGTAAGAAVCQADCDPDGHRADLLNKGEGLSHVSPHWWLPHAHTSCSRVPG